MDKKVRVTVLMDDLAGKMRNIRAHHGLSFLFDIQYPGGNTFRLLFDSGTNGQDLINNMRILEIDPDTIDAAMITHKHYDHLGGLPQVLETRTNPGLSLLFNTFVKRFSRYACSDRFNLIRD